MTVRQPRYSKEEFAPHRHKYLVMMANGNRS
jgi:hypothetical protein